MRAMFRLAAVTLLAAGAFAHTAWAAPITVAEFRWDTITDPGIECPDPSVDPSCVPADPFTQSIFTLTNIWDGPSPGPTLFNNQLSLPSGDLAFFDLEPLFPLNFDQFSEVGTPAFAAVSISFMFGTDLITLGATLVQPDTFAVLQFTPAAEPIPEPGTFALVGLGALLVARRARLSRRSVK